MVKVADPGRGREGEGSSVIMRPESLNSGPSGGASTAVSQPR
jgi:hypothetical protein